MRQVQDFGKVDEIAFICRGVAWAVWVATLGEAGWPIYPLAVMFVILESTAKWGAAVTSIPCHREIRISTAPHFAVLLTLAAKTVKRRQHSPRPDSLRLQTNWPALK